MRVKALLELTRPRLLPSSLADVIAGTTLAGGIAATQWSELSAGLAFSLLAYAGGMVANDVADVRQDEALGRMRPLQRADVTRAQASIWTCLLLASALVVAPARLGSLPLLLISGVLIYDFGVKSIPILGALVLGACRALNLWSGILLAHGGFEGASLGAGICAAYGLYTALTVWHGSREERPATTKAHSNIILITAALIPLSCSVFLQRPAFGIVAALPTLLLCLHTAMHAPSNLAAELPRRTGILLRGFARFGFVICCAQAAWPEAVLLSLPAWLLPWLLRPKRWT